MSDITDENGTAGQQPTEPVPAVAGDRAVTGGETHAGPPAPEGASDTSPSDSAAPAASPAVTAQVVPGVTPAPVAATAQQVAPATEAAPPKKKSHKVAIIVAAVAAVVLVVAGIAYNQYAQEQQAKKDAYNDYIDNITLASYDMLDGAAKAETMGNTVSEIWHDAIFEDDKDAWSADTQQYYSTDFNEALSMYYADSSTKSAVSDIESSQSEVQFLMGKLSNPPEGLESAYATVTTMYQDYLQFTNLAIDPKGSYQTFNQNFSKYDEDTVTQYNTLKTQIPEKEG